MGLTGVGKSTAVHALAISGTPLTLLPNRRALTDELIIPDMQRAAGEPVRAVTDRLERFELTRRYRETHPGGMVYALSRFLEANPHQGASTLVFDNLRGVDEARAAVAGFPEARFILLGAPPLMRLLRLVGRHDSFDQVSEKGFKSTSFTEQLFIQQSAIDKLETVFDPNVLARLAAQGVPEDDPLKAARIILSEAQNYDMTAAAKYFRKEKDGESFLHLDTAKMSVDVVRAHI